MQRIKLTQMEVENKLIEFNEKKELQEMEINTLKKQLKLTTVKLKRSESKLSMSMERLDSMASFSGSQASPFKKEYNKDIVDEVDEEGSSDEDLNERGDSGFREGQDDLKSDPFFKTYKEDDE